MWTESEIRAVGYNIRDIVSKELKLKALYLSKVRNLELVSQGFSIKPINPLVVRGRQLAPTLGELDDLNDHQRIKEREKRLRKQLKSSITQNLKLGVFYRTYRGQEGQTVNVFNRANFMRRYKLKQKFEEDPDSGWRLVQTFKPKTENKDALLEIAVQMVRSGRAIC